MKAKNEGCLTQLEHMSLCFTASYLILDNVRTSKKEQDRESSENPPQKQKEENMKRAKLAPQVPSEKNNIKCRTEARVQRGAGRTEGHNSTFRECTPQETVDLSIHVGAVGLPVTPRSSSSLFLALEVQACVPMLRFYFPLMYLGSNAGPCAASSSLNELFL